MSSTSSLPAPRKSSALATLVVRDDIALHEIPPARWDALVTGQPLLSHAFLSALEDTGCATPATGWTARPLTAWHGGTLVGALPLYAKTHSYGEYVFDWSWADAYRRHGRRYYPKLVCAIPFTPA
ncbi:MAG TPA: peptidogalycan biosysnthesis protein, partial [Casimicrobiaceae bacterium]|nr:peptidogalycan biosysnthesis protein [Casimicrobiaceae bacterium]